MSDVWTEYGKLFGLQSKSFVFGFVVRKIINIRAPFIHVINFDCIMSVDAHRRFRAVSVVMKTVNFQRSQVRVHDLIITNFDIKSSFVRKNII